MIPISQHVNAKDLSLNDPKRKQIGQWINQEIAEALAARAPLETMWRELMRQYDGVPKFEVRETPIMNAPNIEVPVGAAASDSVYAQVIDQVFGANPLLTCRAAGTSGDWTEHAQAMQTFVNWIATNEANTRMAADHGFSDCIQLGTVTFYIPFVEQTRKTKVYKTLNRFPMIRAIPCEDYLVPGGSGENEQESRWAGMRTYMGQRELETYGRLRGWKVEKAKPCGAVSWVRARREQIGKTMTNADKSLQRMFEIWEIYCTFDVDEDGVEEELLVIWDRGSMWPLKIMYNPYDKRPFESASYQVRPHLFNGIGVLEMCRPFQEGATEIYCQWLANALLANCRVWAAREGVVAATEDIFPGKVFPLPDPMTDLHGIEMADVYPSGQAALATTVSFAERRVGVNDMSQRPQAVASSRTPGITALSMLQQVNRRFTPAFEAMHGALSRAAVQAVWRYRERVLAGDQDVIKKINRIMGVVDGALVTQLMRQEDFAHAVSIELTASSTSVNREQDRQSLVILSTQILGPYYQRIVEMSMLAANPQTPEPVRAVLMKIAKATADGVEQILLTFDQVRDPKLLAFSIVAELEQIEAQVQSQHQMQQIVQLIQQAAQQGGQPPNGPGQNQNQAVPAGPAALVGPSQ